MSHTEKKPRKPGSGGKRRDGRTKETVAVTIDKPLLVWVDTFALGKNRSDKVNRILETHRDRIEQLDRDAQTIE